MNQNAPETIETTKININSNNKIIQVFGLKMNCKFERFPTNYI